MSASRSIFILLVAASVLVHFVLAGQTREFPHWTSLVYCGCSFGQLTVLAAWLGMGRGLLLLRVSMVMMATVASAHAMSLVSRPDFDEWFWFHAAVSCLVATPFLILRRQGYTVVAADVSCRRASSLGHRQFSLHQLLACMTMLAMFLSAYRWMEFPGEHLGQVIAYAVALTIAGQSGLWSVYGPIKGLAARLLGAVVIQLVLIGFLSWMVEAGQRHREAWPLAAVCVITFFTATVTCLALNGGGYIVGKRSLVPGRLASEWSRRGFLWFSRRHKEEGERRKIDTSVSP